MMVEVLETEGIVCHVVGDILLCLMMVEDYFLLDVYLIMNM